MLPKFASHVFHHTQRAAQAAAQNPAFRSALGLQNQSAASGASGSLGWANAATGSSWGGAGGAKFNTGSRFYQGYNSAGRAVTQANQSSAHDSTNGRTDDDDDIHVSRSTLVIGSRARPRSSSVHLTGTGRRERQETFGVLQTIQLHQARSRHALAPAPSTKEVFETEENGDDVPSSPRVLVRRNSTAASNSSDLASLEGLEPLEVPTKDAVAKDDIAVKDALVTDPAAPQTVENPVKQATADVKTANLELSRRLDSARISANAADSVIDIVLSFRASRESANVYDYNAMLHALVLSRIEGQPITHILETYNDMLMRQIAPNTRTYRTLILALCDRDREVSRVMQQTERRMRRRNLVSTTSLDDERQLELLQRENNFGSALIVFEAAQTLHQDERGRNLSLGTEVYDALLRSCMIHSNTDAATRIWGALERARHFIPSASCFLHLLGTFAAEGHNNAVSDIFGEFHLLAKKNLIHWQSMKEEDSRTAGLADSHRSGKARATQMLMYVKVVESHFRAGASEKALAIVEEMMDSTAGKNFGPTDVPPPSSAIYAACVRGFLDTGDFDSALVWFGRMRAKDAAPVSEHPLAPLIGGVVARPDQALWDLVVEKLLEHGKFEQASVVFKDLVEASQTDGLRVRSFDRIALFNLNVNALAEVDAKVSDGKIAFVVEYLLEPIFEEIAQTGVPDGALAAQKESFGTFVTYLAKTGSVDSAFSFFSRFVNNMHGLLTNFDAEADAQHIRSMQAFIIDILPVLLAEAKSGSVSVDNVMSLSRALDSAFMHPQSDVLEVYMTVYEQVRSSHGLSTLTDDHWTLFSHALKLRLADTKASVTQQQVQDFVNDISVRYPDSETIPRLVVLELVKSTIDNLGIDAARTVFGSLGSAWTRVLAKHETLLTPSAQPAKATLVSEMQKIEEAWPPVIDDSTAPNMNTIKIDKMHSKSVDEYFPVNPRVTPAVAWERYESGVRNGVYPFPDVMGRLIATFGRQGDLEKVLAIYAAAQSVLASPTMTLDKAKQSLAWYELEDQMIVGLAHAGHVDKAHIHRSRILAQGGTPSADAYGALIQCVKETTDDSASAMALWNEARSRGVVANLYLYNTVISKLSRARKADYALELFAEMKRDYVRPSSVTYGAIIAACCRVGDAPSAETLFQEMVSQPNFRPRIPPYNTMIQFYTHTVRDRERALAYYNMLLEAGIAPTAHTYKLLLDCYGTIEPVDVLSMEHVFETLVSDRRVQVQGVHWAALINAYGCVLKDFPKALSLFDSIATHASSQSRKARLPDALIYEALINVLVTHHQTELLPAYIERMHADGVHMTAYIANLLIRGYAATGRIDDARMVFESLADAPMGVAAPNNHVSHEPWDTAKVDPNAPVFREPSTWEVMVRAELGDGNRDAALALLQRVQERGFPPAVVARISGIMHDESSPVSPYAYSSEGETLVQNTWSPYASAAVATTPSPL